MLQDKILQFWKPEFRRWEEGRKEGRRELGKEGDRKLVSSLKISYIVFYPQNTHTKKCSNLPQLSLTRNSSFPLKHVFRPHGVRWRGAKVQKTLKFQAFGHPHKITESQTNIRMV